MTPSPPYVAGPSAAPSACGRNRPRGFMCECPEPLDYYSPETP